MNFQPPTIVIIQLPGTKNARLFWYTRLIIMSCYIYKYKDFIGTTNNVW